MAESNGCNMPVGREDTGKVVISDGIGTPTLTYRCDGLIYGPLRDAFADKTLKRRIREYIATMEVDIGGFGLNSFLVYLPASTPGKVFLDLKISTGSNDTDEKVCVVIIAGSGTSLQIALELSGTNPELKSQLNVNKLVDHDAQLHMQELYNIAGESKVMSFTVQGGGSACETVSTSLGGVHSVFDYRTDFLESVCRHKHSGIYIISDKEKTDYGLRVDHLVADCMSDVMVKGIAGGNATGNFKGLVYVAQDAQRTEAYQQSRSLLLSDSARILTSPQLEIYADDVKCSHGATVGQIEDNAVFYMRQRGLDEVQARKFQLAGFVNDITNRYPEGDFRQRVESLANQKIEFL